MALLLQVLLERGAFRPSRGSWELETEPTPSNYGSCPYCDGNQRTAPPEPGEDNLAAPGLLKPSTLASEVPPESETNAPFGVPAPGSDPENALPVLTPLNSGTGDVGIDTSQPTVAKREESSYGLTDAGTYEEDDSKGVAGGVGDALKEVKLKKSPGPSARDSQSDKHQEPIDCPGATGQETVVSALTGDTVARELRNAIISCAASCKACLRYASSRCSVS